MKLFSILTSCMVMACMATVSSAQENAIKAHCTTLKSTRAARTTVASPAEENYDVKYLKFNLNMTNLATTLSGDVLTSAKVVAASLPAYVFELDSFYTVDSVLINGVSRPLTTSGVLRTVAVSPALPSGTMFTARVYYNGTAPASSSFFSGISNLTSPSWGTKVTSTLSESYHACDWWPCKQSLHDKIDSVDMWITVEDTLKAGSNGILTAVTPIDATHSRYEWKERYPIDYYLISAAVAPYIDHSYYMHFTGSTDSMLVQNYVYDNPATLPHFQPIIDSTGLVIDYFSTLFGRYPFWHEKYGHCMAPISGGMEHQTMTTLGYFEGTLVAHELGHQWFGDNVTCGTWGDIFMNEGFASYDEDLFMDHFWSHTMMQNDMISKHNDVKSYDTGAIYFTDTADENRIFDTRLSYDKGASLLHMLRFVINNDSAFFQVYKNYQAQMKDSTGTIMDFRNMTVSTLGTANINGINIDTFFNQWAYLQGFPKYNIVWNQMGNDVYIDLTQTTAVPSSVPMFTLPIEFKLFSATGDSIVRVVNNAGSQLFHFTWGRTMTSLNVDPNYWLVYALTGLSHNTALGVTSLTAPAINIHPNPATTGWSVENLQANSTLTLTDLTGRELWNGNSSNNATIAIPAQNLATGLYLLKVVNSDASVSTYKLVKE